MKKTDEHLKNLYLTDEYLLKNPSIHEEDSPWKISKITPPVDEFIGHIGKSEINLLDLGGGVGLILKGISSYMEKSHGVKVNKFAVDLSPGMLELQKKRNPDLKKSLNEDIRKISLGDKESDLTLMIDLLEHLGNPVEALLEVKRISKFVILKVPLEDNLIVRTLNFIKRGKLKQHRIGILGHVNFYNFTNLKDQIEKHLGQVLSFHFTNVFDFFLTSKHYRNNMNLRNKLINLAAACTFRLSPKLSSLIFSDFVIILVKCY